MSDIEKKDESDNARGREALVLECKRLQENSLYNATAHFASSTRIGRLHYFALGPIPIILGALGTWKGIAMLGSGGQVASAEVAAAAQTAPHGWALAAPVLSLLAGMVGSLLAFWNLPETRMRHFSAATAFKSLENDARRAGEIHALDESYPDFKKRVIELGDRYNKLNEASVQTADWAFNRARKKIRAALYKTDAEKREQKKVELKKNNQPVAPESTKSPSKREDGEKP